MSIAFVRRRRADFPLLLQVYSPPPSGASSYMAPDESYAPRGCYDHMTAQQQPVITGYPTHHHAAYPDPYCMPMPPQHQQSTQQQRHAYPGAVSPLLRASPVSVCRYNGVFLLFISRPATQFNMTRPCLTGHRTSPFISEVRLRQTVDTVVIMCFTVCCVCRSLDATVISSAGASSQGHGEKSDVFIERPAKYAWRLAEHSEYSSAIASILSDCHSFNVLAIYQMAR